MSDVAFLILAAGKGTRMKSDLPKVLHPLAGKPMVLHTLEAAEALNPARVVLVVGHGAEGVKAAVAAEFSNVDYAVQEQQRGTGHAVLCAKETLKDFVGTVVILYGDAPLLPVSALARLVAHHQSTGEALTALTTTVENPTGFGRFIRDASGAVQGIVEEKNCTDDQRAITEVNPGIYAVESAALWRLLERVQPSPPKGEYYLTDILHLAVQSGLKVEAVHDAGGWVLLGVNDPDQLAAAEALYAERRA